MSYIKPTLLIVIFTLLLAPLSADTPDEWLRRWNREPGRSTPLTSATVLFENSDSRLFPGLVAVGFRQSDGTFPLGRLIWNGKAYTPLAGFEEVLRDVGFAGQDDAERERTFLTLLQQTYGKLGVKPYTAKAIRQADRPRPLIATRGPANIHRFRVWFYNFPAETLAGEWREVFYVVAADGGVRARTLNSFRPESEGLKGFPEITPKLFE